MLLVKRTFTVSFLFELSQVLWDLFNKNADVVPVADPNLQLIFGALQTCSNSYESEMETEITNTDMNPSKKFKGEPSPGTFQEYILRDFINKQTPTFYCNRYISKGIYTEKNSHFFISW